MSTLELGEVQAHLNITESEFDAELQTFIDAAEAAIAKQVGPLAPTSTTEKVWATGGQIVLSTTPVVSLTSITPYGETALTLVGTIDVRRSGVVYHYDGSCFANRVAPYTVVYSAGYATLPDDLLLAVKEMVRHLWMTQRGGGARRPGSSPSTELANTLPGSAHTLPMRVEQLIAPYRQHAFA